jgi:hypothetical protein
MTIKIFSDARYLPEGAEPVSLLHPFWPEYTKNLQLESKDYLPSSHEVLTSYAKISSTLFEITSLEEADFAVLPFDWVDVTGHSWKTKVNKSAYFLGLQFAQKVKQAGKPIIIFYSGDRSHEHIPIENAIVFHQSDIRSQRQPKEFVYITIYEDLVQNYLGNKLIIRQKQEKPIVGFDGLAVQGIWKKKLKDFIRKGVILSGSLYFPLHEGHALRNMAIKYLSESPLIETNFKIRSKMVFFHADNFEEKRKVRLEYVDNMINSDYILCCRGWGNFSLRFYETLCCGRIPVFIDTDCGLPYDFKIDWKKYSVWVDRKDLSYIAEKVAEFHHNLSPQQFVELQYECRQIWKDWLSYEGFFSNFWQHFMSERPEMLFPKKLTKAFKAV